MDLPTTSTLPFGRSVAECPKRALDMSGVEAQWEMSYAVTTPAVVLFAILSAEYSVNQRFPSGPDVILNGSLPVGSSTREKLKQSPPVTVVVPTWGACARSRRSYRTVVPVTRRISVAELSYG